MLLLRLLFANAFRQRLRTLLVQWGLALAVCAFGLLRTVVDAWHVGPQAASGARLVTHSAVSVIAKMPRHYADRIAALDGVMAVTWRNWFGGVYLDPANFIAQFATAGAVDFRLHPEVVLDASQLQAYLGDRDGAVVGARLARKHGWAIGQGIALEGTAYPGAWRFTVRGIYEGAQPSTDEQQMFVHWDRINESVRQRAPAEADQVGFFIVGLRDASEAAAVSQRIDALFANSQAETRTETEQSFKLGIVAMSEAILRGIDAVSVIVILTILLVMANVMTLTARERYADFATLKALGFTPQHVAALLLAESLVIALVGGAVGVLLTYPVASAFGQAVTIFPVFRVALDTVLWQLAASAAVGLAAAAWPAWALSRLTIVDGLRHGR